MRNFEERKAEVFRRSENRIKERKRNRNRILAMCIPLCLVVTVWSIMILKPYAFEKGLGTQWWVENDPDKFEAYYGSREAYEAIKSWDDVRPRPLEKNLEKARQKGEVCM